LVVAPNTWAISLATEGFSAIQTIICEKILAQKYKNRWGFGICFPFFERAQAAARRLAVVHLSQIWRVL
jgi:hypothetical protein